MNKTHLWMFRISTGIITIILLLGSFMELMQLPNAVASFKLIGYPASLLLLIGAFKLLGAIALWAPLPKIINEWAYAGIAFDFMGATFAHFMIDDSFGKIILPFMLLMVLFVSRYFKYKLEQSE